jgi:hypothetical protein
MEKHSNVSKKRRVNAYAEMREASRMILSHMVLEDGTEDPESPLYLCMASLILTAFMMEAYLNHIGQRKFKCWNDLERLSPESKLNLIAEKLGFVPDYGNRPYQTFKDLFRFRNRVGHGKSVTISDSQTELDADTYDSYTHEFLRTQWEQDCTAKNARRVLEDMEAIIEKVHNASGAGIEDVLFSSGIQVTTSTLLPEEQSPQQSGNG